MADTVIVTGVGGNVGQGIIRCLRASFPELRIVGTNTDGMSAGNHLCDAFHQTPYAFAEGYLERFRAICGREGAGLVVPSTDYETFHLARAAGLPPVAVSPAETCAVFLDKWTTAQVFAKHGIPFAESVLPADYRGQFETVIVKPREGRGSRGIVVDPPDPASFGPDCVVQRRQIGREITSAFYVRKDGVVHGHVTMERSLTAGMTSACQTTFEHDAAVGPIIAKLAAALEIRGSCNLQSIVTGTGEVVPFEVNGRLSGTTSIRSQLGFPDARWTVEEWLYGRPLAPPAVIRGAAVRIAMDVIYPGVGLDGAADPASKHHLF